ncbi:PLP-dependent aminotransferase family protein [Streptomyces sp. JJ38]|uniref:aminotransferase-like domain-containing protein n=1 Tax=Streptomyces sp. JJ38 TaxID=2738128 RepID=UPI001C578615|nr:PLP-dependent aminotransferase family protein [Streptomyces sp. JJ38]MBW1598375.1 PLP-dependent aminotransferase family protein [Streptomyces sp. JJ38]
MTAGTPEAVDRLGLRLDAEDLHGSLRDPVMASMELLNEVSERYPEAISFAAGRPTDAFVEPEQIERYLAAYRRFATARGHGNGAERIQRTLFQYGRTKGVIHDIVARHLAVDEEIEADPEAIVVTVGCQEAMLLVIRTLCVGPQDVMLAASPYYVGFAGAAGLLDVPVLPVRTGSDGIDLEDLRRRIREARSRGLRPRGCYLVPDYSNPTGTRLGLATRHELLALAESEDMLLLEDNPYGLFGTDTRLPTLKSLDRAQRVVYFGSFAKTVMPSARVGYVVADQPVWRAGRPDGLLADRLSVVKSMVSVNTSSITQAVVAGKLIENDFSLATAVAAENRRYADNRECMLQGLAARFSAAGPAPVTWNIPAGGFFAVLTMPFTVDDDLLRRSAAEFGISWVPMRHFYAGGGGHRQIRFSWSSVTTDQIEEGLDRFAGLVQAQVEER